LNDVSQVDVLNSKDYRPTERLLQLYTEVLIGLAKHWLKSVKKEPSINVYQTLLFLYKILVPFSEKSVDALQR